VEVVAAVLLVLVVVMEVVVVLEDFVPVLDIVLHQHKHLLLLWVLVEVILLMDLIRDSTLQEHRYGH
jgi:hypothetical protein